MHHGVVQVGVKGIPHRSEDFHAQTVQNLHKLGHGHLHALFIGGILGGLVQRPLQVVVNGKNLRHRVGLAVSVGRVLFLDGALAEIVVLRGDPQVGVPLGVVFFLPGIGFVLLDFRRFLLRNFLSVGNRLQLFFCCLLFFCHVHSSISFALRRSTVFFLRGGQLRLLGLGEHLG